MRDYNVQARTYAVEQNVPEPELLPLPEVLTDSHRVQTHANGHSSDGSNHDHLHSSGASSDDRGHSYGASNGGHGHNHDSSSHDRGHSHGTIPFLTTLSLFTVPMRSLREDMKVSKCWLRVLLLIVRHFTNLDVSYWCANINAYVNCQELFTHAFR